MKGDRVDRITVLQGVILDPILDGEDIKLILDLEDR